MEEASPLDGEEFIEFKCPCCGKTISFPKEFAGRAQRCPECDETIVVATQGADFGKRFPLPIETERLVLRPFRMDDSTDIAEPYAGDELAAMNWLKSAAGSSLTLGDCTQWLAIVLRANQKVAGWLSIMSPDTLYLQAVVRYSLYDAFQGQGYEAEAIRGILNFCFVGLGMHRVVTTVWSDDSAWRQALESAGMRLEGEAVEDEMREGEWANTCNYAILEREYLGRKSEPPVKS